MPLTVSDGELVVHGDKLGTGQPCCCREECTGCFVDFEGSFDWTFTAADCNGNAVNMEGTIVDGTDPNGELQVMCTEDIICLGDPPIEGLLLSLFNGVCQWRDIVPGGVSSHSCEDARSLVGTYTLKRCATGQTGTLVIS